MEGSYDGFIKDNSIESKCYFASLLQQTVDLFQTQPTGDLNATLQACYSKPALPLIKFIN